MQLSVVCEAAPLPDRLNEDACFLASDGEDCTLLVVDGVSQRIKTSRMRELAAGTTPGRFAARLTRDIIAGRHREQLSLPELLLMANNTLRSQLETAFGEVSIEALADANTRPIGDDPRLVRLLLPACVVTLARIDLVKRELSFAHAGDTALYLFMEDGAVVQATRDFMAQHDRRALELARSIQQEMGVAHFSDVTSDQRVVDLNRQNGIFHNYVDEFGASDDQVGVGVVDGLPELEHYIQHETCSLDGVAGVLLCSDGFPWPAPLDENDTERVSRLEHMRQLIERHGIQGYVDRLREAQRKDASLNAYPRFKAHDDIAAIYAEL